MLKLNNLHIGDRVKMGAGSLIAGEYATVCDLRPDVGIICLRTDCYHSGQHDCDGTCDIGHGWKTSIHNIAIVFQENHITESDLMEVLYG